MSEASWFQRKRGKIWLIIFLAVFINLFVILGIILAIEPYWGDFNWELSNMIGIYTNYIYILLLIIAIPLVYTGFLFIKNLRRLYRMDEIKPSIIHKILSIFVLSFFDLLLVVLLVLFGEEAAVVAAVFENASIFIFLAIDIGLFVLLYPLLTLLQKLIRGQNGGKLNPKLKASILLACMVVGYGLAFLLPFIFTPANVIRGVLPQKPSIIAHRGAAHLAPENTIVAAEATFDLGCDGWEIDVQISSDGIPFLMHDDTLQRTTNVEDIFPSRAEDPASSFNLTELMQLNAGNWFVELDPFYAIAKGLVSQSQIQSYQNATIPTLQEAINFTITHNLILDVDFKTPPSSHPYYAQYFNICLSLLNASDLDKQIWIATGNRNWLDITKSYTNLTTTWLFDISNPPTLAEFQATGYEMVNTHYALSDDLFKAYDTEGIPVNAYTVDTLEIFSQLWCLGVDFITTNEPHRFVGLSQPNWYLHLDVYILFWVVIYALGLSIIFISKQSKK